MKVKEWKDLHPGQGFMTRWAADTLGGFGKKGWSAYGNCDNCDIIREEETQLWDGPYPVLWLWDTDVWGPCPEE